MIWYEKNIWIWHEYINDKNIIPSQHCKICTKSWSWLQFFFSLLVVTIRLSGLVKIQSPFLVGLVNLYPFALLCSLSNKSAVWNKLDPDPTLRLTKLKTCPKFWLDSESNPLRTRLRRATGVQHEPFWITFVCTLIFSWKFELIFLFFFHLLPSLWQNNTCLFDIWSIVSNFLNKKFWRRDYDKRFELFYYISTF